MYLEDIRFIMKYMVYDLVDPLLFYMEVLVVDVVVL
jgi:hypothetical protein